MKEKENGEMRRENEMKNGTAAGAGESAQGRIEELLERCPKVQISPIGFSMYPTLVPGRDQVILEKADVKKLRRGDVVLCRREEGALMLHRLCRIGPDGYYTVGDNQTEPEGPFQAQQIRGRMTALIRKGRKIEVTDPIYRFASWLWLLLRPVRDPIKKPLAVIKRRLKGKK